MNILLAIGSFQSLFFAALLVNKKGRTICDKALALWLGLLSLHLAVIYCKYLGLYEDYPHLIGSTSSFIFLYGPMLFFYVDNYSSNFPGFRNVYFLHLIPFVAYNIFMIPFYLKSGDEKIVYYTNAMAEAPPFAYSMFGILKAATMPAYLVLILADIQRHRNNLKFYFCNFDKKDLNWVRYLLVTISLVALLIIAIGIRDFDGGVVFSDGSERWIFIAVSIWVFGIGFYGLQQTPIFQNVTFDMREASGPTSQFGDSAKLYKMNKLQSLRDHGFEEKLNNYLADKKPFLKPKLTIDELADELSITPHDLSAFINESMGKTFFDLVNSFRVEELKNRLKDPANSNLTLLGNAQESGFNSKASLNRIFKKHTGVSPSQYLKRHSSQ